jgi:predicted Zn-dependent protease
MILKEKEAKEILEKAIKLSTAKEIAAALYGGANALSRFANNTITQNIEENDITLSISAAFDNREGMASTNKLDDESLKNVVEVAEANARLMPPNPEHMAVLSPQQYEKIDAYVERTANFGPMERAQEIRNICQQGDKRELTISGTLSNGDGFVSLANSQGLFAYHCETSCGFSMTARTKDGTGSAKADQSMMRDIEQLNIGEMATEAMITAEKSQNPKTKEPGDYTVVLTPSALVELLFFFFFGFDARAADEGRSFLSDREKKGNKLGQKIVGENITIRSQASHPQLLSAPFSASFRGYMGGSAFDAGLPIKDRSWIEEGVVKNLIYSRYWAQQKDKEPVPFPSNVIMEGGKYSFEDLIKNTKQGILINHFWYIRMVDPNTALVTGLTRDGNFWIEDGKIQYPIKNFRFNESPLVLLNNIEMMTEPVKTGFAMLPAVKANNFTFSSLSEAV